MTEQTGARTKKEEKRARQKAAKQERLNKRQLMEDMLEEARMQREERILTDKTINSIVPLTLVGLIANFIPYFLIFVPIEESGICWLYYLTRSPYQLERIENWLYFSSEAFKYIINAIELMVLLYFLIFKIKKMTQEKIEIAQESKLMILSWFFFSFANMTMQIVSSASNIDDVDVEKAIAIAAFSFVYARNLSIAIIAFYYSVIKQI